MYFQCSGSQINLLLIVGDEYLVEHQIRNIWAEEEGKHAERAKITIVMRRRMEYHLFNTFLQIAILLLIGMLSLYFDPDNFTDRIMVTLTTLLVIVTIMSSIQGVRFFFLKYGNFHFESLIQLLSSSPEPAKNQLLQAD